MSNRPKISKLSNWLKAAKLSNVATRMFQDGRLDEAKEIFARSIALHPGIYEAWQNLGSTLIELGHHDEGRMAIANALRIKADDANAYHAMAVSLRLTNQIDEAIPWCQKALQLDPTREQSRLQLAHLRLLQGDLLMGFRLHEWAREDAYNKSWVHKSWNGQDQRGLKILILGEQGFGDDLHFVRYVKQVKSLGAKIILGCKPPLARLFRAMPEIDVVHPFNEPPPDFDYFCPVMRLPYIFETTLSTIPGEVPYLHADPDDIATWSERLSKYGTGMRVGLCWAGAARKHDPKVNRVDQRRSMRLSDFAPLAAVPNVTFFSLQLGDGSGQDAPDGMHLVDLTSHIRDFAHTAALIENLDLVITVDTSVAHLAGGMAKPVWMLSRFDGCWRWLMDRSDSPWYPSMQIYRQSQIGDWGPVVAQIASDLNQATMARTK